MKKFNLKSLDEIFVRLRNNLDRFLTVPSVKNTWIRVFFLWCGEGGSRFTPIPAARDYSTGWVYMGRGRGAAAYLREFSFPPPSERTRAQSDSSLAASWLKRQNVNFRRLAGSGRTAMTTGGFQWRVQKRILVRTRPVRCSTTSTIRHHAETRWTSSSISTIFTGSVDRFFFFFHEKYNL